MDGALHDFPAGEEGFLERKRLEREEEVRRARGGGSREAREVLGRRPEEGSGGKMPKHKMTLTLREKRIIAYHLKGRRGTDIAKLVGCSTAKVYKVLSHPLTKKILDVFEEGLDRDIAALKMKAVEAVGDAMDAKGMKQRLEGVDRYVKLVGALKPAEGSGGVGNQVNLTVVMQAREGLGAKLKELQGRVLPQGEGTSFVPPRLTHEAGGEG